MHDVYVDHCGDAAVMKMPMMTMSHHPSIVWVTTNVGVVTKIVVRHAIRRPLVPNVQSYLYRLRYWMVIAIMSSSYKSCASANIASYTFNGWVNKTCVVVVILLLSLYPFGRRVRRYGRFRILLLLLWLLLAHGTNVLDWVLVLLLVPVLVVLALALALVLAVGTVEVVLVNSR